MAARKVSPAASMPATEIAFPVSSARPCGRYVSDTTVLEEALHEGRLIGLYWSGAGQVQRENIVAALPEINPVNLPIQTFELEIDGQSLHNRWDWVGGTQRPGQRGGTTEAVIELRHQVRPVTVKVVTRLDGTPILARYLEITNTGTAPAALASVSPCAGLLWHNTLGWGNQWPFNPTFDTRKAAFSVGYFTGQEQADEGNFVWQPIEREGVVMQRSTGRTHAWPYYIARNEATGEMFFLGLAWGGNYSARFTSSGAILTFSMGLGGPGPLRVIAPGETVTSPETHIGPVRGTMDQAIGKWLRHIRASVIPPRPAGRAMFTVAGRVVEEPGDWILREIDIAKEMGAEAFMVDAGWYGSDFASWPKQRGDWNVGDWMPGGLDGARNHAHDSGLLFGLWHEAECISPESKLAKQHPDWVQRPDGGRGRDMIDLANPAAAKFFEETVLGLLGDHKLDFYKLDYNTRPGESSQTLRDGFAENEQWRHFETLYRTYDRVLAQHPDACLENCASGGGRNDLGMVARFHYFSESDISAYPYSILAINAMTMFIPPEAVAYYHNHMPNAHQMTDLDTHLRVTLFGVPIFVGFGAQGARRDTQYFARTRRYVELHKGFCRPILAGGAMVYHHTPFLGIYNTKAQWCVLEYAAADRSRGYAGVFRLAGNDGGGDEYILRLRGLDLGRQYKVTRDNLGQTYQTPAMRLAEEGIRIRLDMPGGSELVMFEAV